MVALDQMVSGNDMTVDHGHNGFSFVMKCAELVIQGRFVCLQGGYLADYSWLQPSGMPYLGRP